MHIIAEMCRVCSKKVGGAELSCREVGGADSSSRKMGGAELSGVYFFICACLLQICTLCSMHPFADVCVKCTTCGVWLVGM